MVVSSLDQRIQTKLIFHHLTRTYLTLELEKISPQITKVMRAILGEAG